MRVESLAGTVGWRIDPGRDILAPLHKHHRRSVKQGDRRGLRVTDRQVENDAMAGFRALYESTMERVGAAAFYHFPDAYWRSLRTGLGPNLSLAEISDEGGEVLAAALLLRTPPWLHYHLGASTEQGRRVGATAPLFVGVARTAQAEGFRVFHLGGGIGGSADSLLQFKMRFDPGGLRESAIGKQIHDLDEYRRLAGLSDISGFFPSYRTRG
jgi:serine/alanine adding enzyme